MTADNDFICVSATDDLIKSHLGLPSYRVEIKPKQLKWKIYFWRSWTNLFLNAFGGKCGKIFNGFVFTNTSQHEAYAKQEHYVHISLMVSGFVIKYKEVILGYLVLHEILIQLNRLATIEFTR